MEMKPGYKQTEVGTIPEEWRVCRLSQVLAAGPKNGYSGRSGKSASGTPTLTLTATTSGRMVLNDQTVKQLVETLDARSEVFLRTNDVLVQRSNTLELVGTTAVFEGPNDVYAYPDLMMRLRFNSAAVGHWFWRYANSSSGRRYFVSMAAGSTGTMPKISGDKLRDMPVPLPPPREQDLITEALRDADALIDSLDKLVSKKRQIKQGAVQELLTGKRRLPGFESRPGYKQTEVGAIPEDWGLEFIENIAHITTGSRNTQDRIDDGQYPFFVRSQTIERINSYSFDGEAVLTAGDGVGTGKVFHYINSKFDAHQRVYLISDFGERITGYFFYLYFGSHFYARIMQMTAKSSVDSVRREMIARMLIPLPPTTAEQEALARIFSEMDAEISALEAQVDKARQLKRGMMQELLMGRIRLI